MPFEPGPAVLQDILTGCQIQGNVDFGIQAAKRLIELRPHREGGYVLLSNVYATAGRWNDVAGMRILMTEEYSSDLDFGTLVLITYRQNFSEI
ncbi:hypothetical protein GOBAR_DD32966 [Gossypium barbadense]|nr:hypothetical protein GOBAR_DD32966 [Gossypium barbadense]